MPSPPPSPSPPTWSCADARPRLLEMLDGELTGGADTLLRDHLAVCPGCRAAFESERRFLRRVRRVRDHEPAPASLRSAIAARLDQLAASRGRP